MHSTTLLKDQVGNYTYAVIGRAATNSGEDYQSLSISAPAAVCSNFLLCFLIKKNCLLKDNLLPDSCISRFPKKNRENHSFATFGALVCNIRVPVKN